MNKVNLKLTWRYKMVLALPNREIKLKEIEEYILKAKDLFNQYCMKSANVKEIVSCSIDETNDLLMITLASMNQLPVGIRGLRLFTQRIIEILESEKGEEFVSKIIRRKSFFRMISCEEVKNIKLEKSEEIESIEEVNSIKDKKVDEEIDKEEINIDELLEANTIIAKLFFNAKTLTLKEQESREKILSIVNQLKKGE